MPKHSGWGPRVDEQPKRQRLLRDDDDERDFDERFNDNISKLQLNEWFAQNITKYWQRWFPESFNKRLSPLIQKFVDRIAREVGVIERNIRRDFQAELAKLATGFAIRGTFNATATYAKHDIVALNGASFIATKSNPGSCPGEGWQLLASAGSRGKPADDTKVHRLEREVTALRAEVKALRDMVNGNVTELPAWPSKKA
jgi:hypothetical protein